MTTINLMMSSGQATYRYYLIEYFKKTLEPDIRYQVVAGYFGSRYINNIIFSGSFTFVNLNNKQFLGQWKMKAKVLSS